jgi:nitric oxide dioxygenase
MIYALVKEPLPVNTKSGARHMTNEQIKLVQDSFRQVAPIAETAAQLFYARLFELDPDLELLFKGNLSEQGRKLMA